MTVDVVLLEDALSAGTVASRCSAVGLLGYHSVARLVVDDPAIAERLVRLLSCWLDALGSFPPDEAMRTARPWGLGDLPLNTLRGGPGDGLLADVGKLTEHWYWLRSIAADPSVAAAVLAVEPDGWIPDGWIPS